MLAVRAAGAEARGEQGVLRPVLGGGGVAARRRPAAEGACVPVGLLGFLGCRALLALLGRDLEGLLGQGGLEVLVARGEGAGGAADLFGGGEGAAEGFAEGCGHGVAGR